MRIHLAGAATNRPNKSRQQPIATEVLSRERYPYHLTSFARAGEERYLLSAWREFPCVVIVDSGAFSVWNVGSTISLSAYADWIRGYPERFPMLAEAHFMTLDVIGDQRATWRNTDRLLQRGCRVMPILTCGCDPADIERAYEANEYIALGGFGGKPLNVWQPWALRVFREAEKRLPKLPRIHLLGQTNLQALLQMPAYSGDSTSWISPLRYGASAGTIGGRKAPRASESSGAEAATYMAITKIVRDMRRIQDTATRYWKERGIEWPD